MRTYKILKARAEAFDDDPEVRELIATPRDDEVEPLLSGSHDAQRVRRLRALELDPDALARRGLRYERLDQLMVEHVLGARG